MQNTPEIEIIEDCLKGTQRSFKALYEMYNGYVYTICTRYGISAIEIKDCMQIIFMEIFQSLPKYDVHKSKFKTWLTSIVIHQILSYKRTLNIQYTTLDTEEINVIESDFLPPVDSLMDTETMMNMFQKMPAKYVTVFNLFIIDGYSHKEIAQKLNISEGSSRILLHRGRVWAMHQLKDLFKDSVHTIKKTNCH